MPRSTLWAAVALAAVGCAGSPERNAEVADALARVEGSGEYADTERCLSTTRYDSVDILDEQHLLFAGNGPDEVWLNTLRSRCPGLHRNDVLAFEMNGTRLCSLDSATVVQRFLFWQRTGPTCTLGEFHELTDAQASLIREAM